MPYGIRTCQTAIGKANTPPEYFSLMPCRRLFLAKKDEVCVPIKKIHRLRRFLDEKNIFFNLIRGDFDEPYRIFRAR